MPAGSLVTVVCTNDKCGYSAEFELTQVQSLKDPTRLKFNCKSCKAKGRVAAYTPMPERQQPPRIKCAGCQELLSEERLKAMPGTHLCVECSSSGPNDDKRKFVKDSFGSREAFKRDRGSWRR